jgi:plasmid maintenance system antidote protein VapI
MRLRVKIHDRFGNDGTDTLDRNQVLPGFITLVGAVALFRRNGFQGSFFKGCIRQVRASKTLGIHLAHMTDTEAKQKAIERNLAPVIHRIVELLHGSRAETFDVLKLLERRFGLTPLQRKNIRRRLDLQAVIFRMEKNSTCFSPRPSMSNALRDTK